MEYGLREVDYRENMDDNGMVSISVSNNYHLKKYILTKKKLFFFKFKYIKLNENLLLIYEYYENNQKVNLE